MNFDVLENFYDTCKNYKVTHPALDLKSKFLIWLNSLLHTLPEKAGEKAPDNLIKVYKDGLEKFVQELVEDDLLDIRSRRGKELKEKFEDYKNRLFFK